MLKRYLLRRTLAVWIASLLLVSLVLTACGSAAESTSEVPDTTAETEEAADVSADVKETPTVAEQKATATVEEKPAVEEQETVAAEAETPTVPAETEGEGATPSSSSADEPSADESSVDEPASSTTLEAPCQAVEIPSNDLIAAVSDTDWAKGPANAPVTLIEYGDFQ